MVNDIAPLNKLGRKRSVRRGKRQFVKHGIMPTGGTQYEITPAGLAEIEKRARQGHGVVSIAAALGIHQTCFADLRKRDPRCQQAMDVGRDNLGNEINDRLLKKARKGETAALIFLAKGRLGWRETGPSDPNQQAAPSVNITINAPMSDTDFQKLIDVTPAKEE